MISESLEATAELSTYGLDNLNIPAEKMPEINAAIAANDHETLASLLSPYTPTPTDTLEEYILSSGFMQQQNSTNNFVGMPTPDQQLRTFDESYEVYLDNYSKEVDYGVPGTLQGIASLSTLGAFTSVRSFINESGSSLSDDETKEIVSLHTSGNSLSAAEKISNATGQSVADSLSFLDGVDGTIASSLVVDGSQDVFDTPEQIGFNHYLWSGVNTQNNLFTYVSSYEELESEFSSSTREITEVVVHWTETFTNANLSAEQIHDAHNAVGHDGIGYHYVIRRDGSLQRGRPLDQVGEHTTTNGHNNYSIGLAFVGGLNVSTSQFGSEEFSQAASLTRVQFNTFRKFLQAFYGRFSGGQVLGHNDIDPNELDPGFDVIDYCYTVFGKFSMFQDPASEGPFTREELNKRQLEGNDQIGIAVLEKDS
jgi:N-acetylmuramoyl-L-alanine amidase